MNKKHYILALIAMFVMAIGFSSCEDEEEYTTDYNTGTPPTVTVTVIADSTNDVGTYMTLASNQNGIIWWVAIPESAGITELEGYELVLDQIDYYSGGDIEVIASTDSLLHVDLFEGNAYSIYAVATNAAGQSGAVSSVAVTTTDDSDPYVAEFSPAIFSAGLPANTETVLTFNEPVTYVDGKVIELWGYFTGWSEIITADNIVISGNTVTLKHSDYPYGDFIIHSIDAGAFIDPIGNEFAGISGFGYYYKTMDDPASLLENAFENFLGDIVCTDYLYSDSTTVDWGPYGVTISADEDTEEPYDIIIDGFWGYGGVLARMTLNEDGTVSCPANLMEGITYGGEEIVWVRAYNGADPYAPGEPVGHWDWTDNSFNISVEIYVEHLGYFAQLYQVYEQPAAKKASVGVKPQDYPMELIPFE